VIVVTKTSSLPCFLALLFFCVFVVIERQKQKNLERKPTCGALQNITGNWTIVLVLPCADDISILNSRRPTDTIFFRVDAECVPKNFRMTSTDSIQHSFLLFPFFLLSGLSGSYR